MSSLLRAVRCVARSAVPSMHPAVRIAPRRMPIAALNSSLSVASILPSPLRSRCPPMGAAAFLSRSFSSGRALAAASSSSSSSPSAPASTRLVVIGDVGAGKSSLLTAFQSRSRSGSFSSALHPSEHDVLWQLDSGEEVVARRRRLDVALGLQRFQVLDFEEAEEATKMILSRAARRTGKGKDDARAYEAVHGALLVVDATNDLSLLSAAVRSQIEMLPRHWPLLVFLNKSASVSPASIESLVNSLRAQAHAGNSGGTMVVKGCTASEDDAHAVVNIDELLAALTTVFPTAASANKEPFLMAVSQISAASLAVTPVDAAPLDAAPASKFTEVSNCPSELKGRLQLGSVRVDEKLELVGRKGVVWESVVQRLNPEDDSVTLLGSLARPMVSERVHYLSSPNSLPLRSSFEAHLFALAPWEGGRYVPLMDGSVCDVRFSAEDVSASVELLDPPAEIVWGTRDSKVDWLCPGSALTVRMHLAAPTPLRAGMPCTIRQGNQPVAFGIVARTFDRPASPLPSKSLWTQLSQGVYTCYSILYRYVGWWLGPILEPLAPMVEFWLPGIVFAVLILLD